MQLRYFAWIVMSLVCLSSCGTSDKAEEETAPGQASPEQIKQQQKEADRIIDQQLANVRKKEASTFPCSLFPAQELEALVGNPLDSGSYAFNHVTENDRSYKSESCDWSAGFGEGNEARLWVSLPKHFASGTVECSPGSTNSEISGIGDRAWWEYMKSFGMGTLRVCSGKAMLEVKVRVKSKDEAAARKIAEAMANKVLGSQ
jgi:hypothetical protein